VHKTRQIIRGWFGKTCILSPLREGRWGPIKNRVTLTAVTPCQSVFPDLKKGFLSLFSKEIRRKENAQKT